MPASQKTARQKQRDATRARILEAAVRAFTEKGFHGASTRDIARLADTNQGLITYHFSSKEALWRAAADTLFNDLKARLSETLEQVSADDPREYAREIIREYVRFSAACPALVRMMIDEGKVADDRMNWLVDTHIRPHYESLAPDLREVIGLDDAMMPHAFYALAGASSLIFAVAPECYRLTGLQPAEAAAVETHANFVANLLVPPA